MGDAPAWLHTAAALPVPAHPDDTDAILLYSETNVTVVSVDKLKLHVRRAYKILRPTGHNYGTVMVPVNPEDKVTGLRGWCIPGEGKDYTIKDKEAMEISPPKIEGSELISDVRIKMLDIPASNSGNIVGYEYEIEEHPLVLQQTWDFQSEIPVVQSRYTLQLPNGWEYRSFWMNHPELKPTTDNGNELQWTMEHIDAIKAEDSMPPLDAVAGSMIVSFFPAGGATAKSFDTWPQMGSWYSTLTEGRREVSPAMQQKASALTASAHTSLEKIRQIAQFMQRDIRYVAIELGVGGYQPHAAIEVFDHRYGDCKDKATLMSAMLQAVGIESYYVLINVERGAVTPNMPAHRAFDHAILAIRLPKDTNDPAPVATVNNPQLGTLLFFDPTNELLPLGQLPGPLQANYGLLVTPSGGDLVQLPQEPASMNGILRTGAFALDSAGALKGEIHETHLGDAAWSQRNALRASGTQTDKMRPVEKILGASLPEYRLTSLQASSAQSAEQSFLYIYSFEANRYAKNAGDLLLLRPRVVGIESSGFLETKDARKFPVEFDSPRRDTDTFVIELPAGYQIDELPSAVDIDLSFASYHSHSEMIGNSIRYQRRFEVKDVTVPVSQVDQLRKLYRTIAADERNMAVLKLK